MHRRWRSSRPAVSLSCSDLKPAQESSGEAADPEDDGDEAKMQRLLDFFRDLGEQYWGWQVQHLC